MQRFQMHLMPEQVKQLRARVTKTESMAEHIRKAIDGYLLERFGQEIKKEIDYHQTKGLGLLTVTKPKKAKKGKKAKPAKVKVSLGFPKKKAKRKK